MFDLRALEHSTILYEATGTTTTNSSASPTKNGSTFSPSAGVSASSSPLPTPLLRLAFSPTSPTYLSVCHADSGLVQILDTRSPGTPAMEIRGHKAAVNGMAWGGSTMQGGGETSGPGWLATCCSFPFLTSSFPPDSLADRTKQRTTQHSSSGISPPLRQFHHKVLARFHRAQRSFRIPYWRTLLRVKSMLSRGDAEGSGLLLVVENWSGCLGSSTSSLGVLGSVLMRCGDL